MLSFLVLIPNKDINKSYMPFTTFTNPVYVGGKPDASAHYGPWSSVNDYLSFVTDELLLSAPVKGTTIGVLESGTVKEYWNPTSATTFIAKASGGGGSTINVIDNVTSTSSVDALSAKQGKLLNDALGNKMDSDQAFKTINGQSILGTGNIDAGGSSVTVVDNLTSTSTTAALSAKQGKVLNESKMNADQAFKTINGNTILGSGNIEIGGGSSVPVVDSLTSTSTTSALSANQGRVLKTALDAIDTPSDATIQILQQGVLKGQFTLNQSNGTQIDVGEGQEMFFTADILRKAMICRLTNGIYSNAISNGDGTSRPDPKPNMSYFNGFPDPAGQETWAGAGEGNQCTAAANSRICLLNMSTRPWKGRTFSLQIKEGYEIALQTGEVVQTTNWNEPFPENPDQTWMWHSSSNPLTFTCGDVICLMIKGSGTFNWPYMYATLWQLFTLEETPDSVPNPPRQLIDSHFAGCRLGILGDSILAGASTNAYTTACDWLLENFGIIPVPACIAGSCIAASDATWGRDSMMFYKRINNTWQTLAAGKVYNTSGTQLDPDKSLGCLIFGVNDVLMDKFALPNDFVKRDGATQNVAIDTTKLTEGDYVYELNRLESVVKEGLGSDISQMYLIGPYMCRWPGNYPMWTTSVNPKGDTGEDFIRIQRQFAAIKGWQYMDILGSQLNTKAAGLAGDSLHPSQRGHEILGNMIGNFVCGNLLTQNNGIFYKKKTITVGSDELNVLVEI